MAFHYAPQIVTRNLKVYLDANNHKSYPGTGTTWYDLSGNQYGAGLYNTTFTKPNSAKAYGITCDGINGYIYNSSLPGGDDTFTIECIFYHNGSDQGASYGVISWGNSSGPLIYNHTSGTGGHYCPGSPSGDYPGGLSWQINNWNHYVVIYRNMKTTGGNFDLWLNGNVGINGKSWDLHDSGSGRGSNGFTLSGYSTSSNRFKGSYGLLRYYDRDLSDEEIMNNFNATRKIYGL